MNILMLYPDFGILFTAAILSCHDMNILFMIVMPIAVLLLIVSLILNMTMIFMPAAVSGYAYYFIWLFLTSSLFVIFLLLIIRCLHKDPMTLHLPDGKGTSGELYSFWLWICLPSISCGRLPWISHLFFIHPLSKSQSLTLMFPQATKTIMTAFPEKMNMAVLIHSTCLHSSIMPARTPVNQKKML